MATFGRRLRGKSKLRILHIINSLDPRQGGTVECVRQVGSSISGKGHTVEVAVCGDQALDKWVGKFPLRAHPLGPGLGKYAYTPRLRKWLQENGPSYDAWVINGLWQYQGLAGSSMARKLGIPYFVYAHGMLDPWNRRSAPAKYLKKFLYWLLAEKATIENATALVFTSQEESQLARHYFPVTRWRELVVGNGVAEPPSLPRDHVASFRAEHSIPPDQKVLLFLSRIHPKKGIDLLLRAFSALPSLRESAVLVVAGDGDADYVSSLKRMSAQLGIEQRIRWTGPLYETQKWIAFSSADLFVLPSHQENFGIVIAEALAVGTPVLTTTAVNTHGLVEAYGAGIVCSDEQADVVRAFQKWQAMDANALQAMRTNARRCFENELRIDGASHKLLEAIEKAVAARKANNGRVH